MLPLSLFFLSPPINWSNFSPLFPGTQEQLEGGLFFCPPLPQQLGRARNLHRTQVHHSKTRKAPHKAAEMGNLFSVKKMSDFLTFSQENYPM